MPHNYIVLTSIPALGELLLLTYRKHDVMFYYANKIKHNLKELTKQ